MSLWKPQRSFFCHTSSSATPPLILSLVRKNTKQLQLLISSRHRLGELTIRDRKKPLHFFAAVAFKSRSKRSNAVW
jgi:hypothetical protein